MITFMLLCGLFAASSLGASADDCVTECPQDCGQIVLDNGCLECDCSDTFFRSVPLPQRPEPDSRDGCFNECPQDCGQIIGDDGCVVCTCDELFFQVVPEPENPLEV